MHYQYLSTHPEGFNDIIKSSLSRVFPDAELITQNKSESVFKTKSKIDTAKLPFFETTYLILKEYKPEITALFNWCESNADQITRNLSKDFPNKSFRVISTPPKSDSKKYSHRIDSLHEKLGKYGLKIEKGSPDIEIKLFVREKIGFVSIRLSPPPESIDAFQEGGIRKEIAYLLVELSEPTSDDIFCDPMCGSGIIPITRALHSDYEEINAYDLKINRVEDKLRKMGLRIRNLNLIEQDFLSVNNDRNFNKFVIDPPWGLMKKVGDIENLYIKLLEKVRMMEDHPSKIVLITNQSSALERAVRSIESIEQSARRETKVSGMDATVFQLISSKL